MTAAALELRQVPNPDSAAVDVQQVDALLDGDLIARLLLAERGTQTQVVAAAAHEFLSPSEAEALIGGLVEHTARGGVAELSLVTLDPCTRDVARRVGFRGALRDELVGAVEACGDPRSCGPLGEGLTPAAVCARIEQLAPEVAARPLESGPVRGVLRRLRTGFPTMALEVSRGDATPRTRVDVPDRADLLVEQLARSVDTITAVQEHFGDAVPPLRMAFDHADFGLRHGTTSGEAAGGGEIHINASWVNIEGLLAFRRPRTDALPRLPPSARPVAVFNNLDGTTAHEAWHQIDFMFQGRHYATSMELRRALGVELGVETLEQALRGADRGAPAAWRAARRRLIEEVSPYAATATQEATAEMFKLWWCRVGDPGPLVARFGQLVESLVVAPRR